MSVSIEMSFRGAVGDEESRTAFVFRARFLAELTLSTQSEILRFAQDDSEGLGMTASREVFHQPAAKGTWVF
jgi:hypothetical protein